MWLHICDFKWKNFSEWDAFRENPCILKNLERKRMWIIPEISLLGKKKKTPKTQTHDK